MIFSGPQFLLPDTVSPLEMSTADVRVRENQFQLHGSVSGTQLHCSDSEPSVAPRASSQGGWLGWCVCVSVTHSENEREKVRMREKETVSVGHSQTHFFLSSSTIPWGVIFICVVPALAHGKVERQKCSFHVLRSRSGMPLFFPTFCS